MYQTRLNSYILLELVFNFSALMAFFNGKFDGTVFGKADFMRKTFFFCIFNSTAKFEREKRRQRLRNSAVIAFSYFNFINFSPFNYIGPVSFNLSTQSLNWYKCNDAEQLGGKRWKKLHSKGKVTIIKRTSNVNIATVNVFRES